MMREEADVTTTPAETGEQQPSLDEEAEREAKEKWNTYLEGASPATREVWQKVEAGPASERIDELFSEWWNAQPSLNSRPAPQRRQRDRNGQVKALSARAQRKEEWAITQKLWVKTQPVR